MTEPYVPNKERIKLWVDALRSGRYAQTTGVLYLGSSNTYCCLGVACEVALKNGFEWVDADVDPDFWRIMHGDLPYDVADWFGLSGDGNPAISDLPCSVLNHAYPNTSAAHANDELGWDFARIADEIETKYLTSQGGSA